MSSVSLPRDCSEWLASAPSPAWPEDWCSAAPSERCCSRSHRRAPWPSWHLSLRWPWLQRSPHFRPRCAPCASIRRRRSRPKRSSGLKRECLGLETQAELRFQYTHVETALELEQIVEGLAAAAGRRRRRRRRARLAFDNLTRREQRAIIGRVFRTH